MYNHLLLKAFEKAGEEIHSTVVSRQATHLSDLILENSSMPYGERSLRDKFKEVQKGISVNLHLFVANALSVYLGYADYSAYVAQQHQVPKPKKVMRRSWIKPYKYYLIVLGVGLLFLGVYATTKTRWMVWDNNHYKEVSFNEQLLQNGALKVYNKDRIENFKKTSADCNTLLVFNGGTLKLWYGKNKTGDLELFTTPGLHPETGKTLKELTQYMYDKYICKEK